MAVDPSGSIQSVSTMRASVDRLVRRRVLDSSSNVFEAGGLYQNAFVSKHTGTGNLLWKKTWGGIGDDSGTAVVVDSWDNVIVTGYFTHSITIGGADLANTHGTSTNTVSGTTLSNTHQRTADTFVVKMTNDGETIWVAQIGGPGSAVSYGLAVDSVGSVFVTGWFDGTMLFGPAGHDGLKSAGDRDIFVAKLESNGKLLWVQQAGGIGADSGNAVVVDQDGGVFVTGSFSQTAKFGKVVLESSGEQDLFWMKIHEEEPHERELPKPPKLAV